MSKVLGVTTLVTKEKKTSFNGDKKDFLDGMNALRKFYSNSQIVHYLDGSVTAKLSGAISYLDLDANFKVK